MQSLTSDVIVIGGGVIGCAVAYFLRKRRVGVMVIERGEPGEQASGAAAGLLAPLGPLSGTGPLADLLLSGFARFPALVAELEEATGQRLDYARTGSLRVVCSAKRVAHLRKRWESWQPLGLRMRWLSREEACQHEPLLVQDVCAAVHAPEEAQVEARAVTRAFAQAASQLGARIVTQQEVVGLHTQGAKVTGVQTSQGTTVACGAVVLAAGAWTGICSAWLRTPLPVQPLYGQLLSYTQTSPPLRSIIFGERMYLIPRGQRIIVGATREERGFDLSITGEGTARLKASASRLIPQLATSPIEATWTGLRPKTPDTRPILGLHPFWENVLIASGHNSVGIMLSGITGETMADLLLTRRPDPLIQPFSVERLLSQAGVETQK